MAQQVQRSRAVSKQIEEEVEERAEQDTNEVSEQAECCLADIDAIIEEACCILAEVAEVVDPAPTEEQFTAERNRLMGIYIATPNGTAENEAWEAVLAYENKWPQHAHLCTC